VSRVYQLGDLQYAIMRILWNRGEAAAAEVHAALLDERGLAPTTIATMLSKMEKKGVVIHRTVGRQYVYRATVEERDVRRSMVSELIQRAFQGDATALVNHLLNELDIDQEELERLKDMIETRSGEEENGDA
jgi:predicted transcriptional regulator